MFFFFFADDRASRYRLVKQEQEGAGEGADRLRRGIPRRPRVSAVAFDTS